MSVVYYFDPFVAKELKSVEAAVFLSNIDFWLRTNRANNEHFIDGRYWTYNTQEAFAELYPYMNERQIKYLIKKLQEDGYLLVSKHNKANMDRTNWYSLTDKYYTMVQNCTFESTKLSDAKNKNVPAIPYINQSYINQDSSLISSESNEKKDINSSDDSFISKEKPKRSAGILPSREEVDAYIAKKGYHFSSAEFFKYYTNDGELDVLRFKDGKLVKDWHRCCVTFEDNWKKQHGNQPAYMKTKQDDQYIEYARELEERKRKEQEERYANGRLSEADHAALIEQLKQGKGRAFQNPA